MWREGTVDPMPARPPAVALLHAAFLLGLTGSLVGPAPAAAATCADYRTQAAAQATHDTRDADGDGRYCQDLPCPCASTPTPTAPTAPRRPRLGPPVAFAPRTRSSGCSPRGALPDPRCTPGSRFTASTPRIFCQSGYTAELRDVGTRVKERVYRSYGLTARRAGQYAVDHLVPLELGGSNSLANLFPQAVDGAHEKDDLEDLAHARACHGRGDWRTAQRAIARDWTALYVRLVGDGG